jgi:hypothetical protein
MPGLLPTFDRGPLTFAANVNIPGGSLVEPDGTTTRIKVATANSAVCLGVALGDAAAFDYNPGDSLDPWGNQIANMNGLVPNEVAVAYQGVFKLKNAASGTGFGTIAFGQLVKCAANGEVMPHAGADTFAMVVGRCVEPAGIVAGARGKIVLNLAGA